MNDLHSSLSETWEMFLDFLEVTETLGLESWTYFPKCWWSVLLALKDQKQRVFSEMRLNKWSCLPPEAIDGKGSVSLYD